MEGSRKIVEVFIETDSESESYCSSEEPGETTETALDEEVEHQTELLTEDLGGDRGHIAAKDEGLMKLDSCLKENLDSVQSPPFFPPDFEREGSFHSQGEGVSSSPRFDELADPEINFQEGMEVELDIQQLTESSFPAQTDTLNVFQITPSPPEPSSPVEDISKDKVPVPSFALDSTAQPKMEDIEEHPGKRMSKSSTPEPKPIDPNKVYCFCRQPADTYSMIYCHECLEWFHGECVGITRQKAACIKHFYCPLCIDKNPGLVTVFESRNDKDGPQLQKPLERVRERLGQTKGSTQGKRSRSKKHSRRCGECVACLTDIDCRKCRFCRDMTKYGGRGSLRQKCIKRQCLRYSRILYAEDPLSSKQNVIQDDIAAELRAVGGSLSSLTDCSIDTHNLNPIDESMKSMNSSKESQLLLSKDTTDNDLSYPDEASLESGRVMETTTSRAPLTIKKKTGPSKKQKPSGRVGGVKGGGVTKGKTGMQKKQSSKAKSKTRLSASDFDYEGSRQTSSGRSVRQPFSDILLGSSYFREDVHTPQQCQGPGCVFATKPHSKYCSEECGIQLALKRIHKYLPEKKKLQDGKEPLATAKNKENLKKLEEQQKTIKRRLEELDNQTVTIDNHVQRLTNVTPVSEDESEADNDDLTIHCATCSQPVTLKKAMVHFEKCFSKLEGEVSFGSIVKNEGTNIFCDKYDHSQKTYCKRLRVLCPEHTKEPKIGPKEVCGCPFESAFPSTIQRSKHYCRLPKKSCPIHYCWEKLRKAEIDQQKLNLYLKLEELSEQSRLNQWQMDCRNSLLAIMLHHTVDHNADPSSTIDQHSSTSKGTDCYSDSISVQKDSFDSECTLNKETIMDLS